MKLYKCFLKTVLLIFANFTALANIYSQVLSYDEMKGFPTNEPGISLGVSACFSGVIDNDLIIAGGCNFPEKPVADGGKKKYYKGIYIASLNDTKQLNWTKVGDLVESSAYGLSIVHENKLILIGGKNNTGSSSLVYCLILKNRKLTKIDTLPSLPFKADNMGGVLLQNTIYLVGGNQNLKPSNSVFYLSLSEIEKGWRQAVSFPGPSRIQSVVVAQNNKLLLWGGFSPSVDGSEPTVSTDGYEFSINSNQWRQLASPRNNKNKTVSLGAGVGITINDSLILCTGGVHKDIFLLALRAGLKYQPKQLASFNYKYLTHKPSWYKFNRLVFVYNSKSEQWTSVGENELLARAGACLLKQNNFLYLINGEIMPGIRSPKITRIAVSDLID